MKKSVLFCSMLIFFLSACSGAKHMQVNLPEPVPEKKETNYSEALYKLGEMSEFLCSFDGKVFVQSKPILDSTGGHTGEIPFDVTEMLQSAINRIGGKIGYVPYVPDYLRNSQAAYYKMGLTPPDVVISGAITEYDRSTEVIGDSADFGAEFGAGGL